MAWHNTTVWQFNEHALYIIMYVYILDSYLNTCIYVYVCLYVVCIIIVFNFTHILC